LWYDALDTITAAIDAKPDDADLRKARINLLQHNIDSDLAASVAASEQHANEKPAAETK